MKKGTACKRLRQPIEGVKLLEYIKLLADV